MSRHTPDHPAPPSDRPGTKARNRDPKKSKRSRESQNASPGTNRPPTPAQTPTRRACSFSRPPTPDGKKRTVVWKDRLQATSISNIDTAKCLYRCIVIIYIIWPVGWTLTVLYTPN
ncbi:hypothetical protein ILYODFUR_005276 [Ilyodon furcidens]|uniref:Uncharacterized protein n=1 Tax=Ilyodon furcidens TaxID=33524 RepID=A0ABV0VDP0_9TELE